MATRAKSRKKTPNRASEVDRILKNNLKAGVMTKEDCYFARKFLNVILEAEEEDLPSIGDPAGMKKALPMPDGSPNSFTSDQNQADFEDSLEPETDKRAFDVDGGSQDAESFSSVYVKKCHAWVEKIEEFVHFLNGIDNPEALNTQLNNADREGSVLKGITRKVGDNISKTAGELSRLGQALNAVVIGAPKKQRELQKLTKIS